MTVERLSLKREILIPYLAVFKLLFMTYDAHAFAWYCQNWTQWSIWPGHNSAMHFRWHLQDYSNKTKQSVVVLSMHWLEKPPISKFSSGRVNEILITDSVGIRRGNYRKFWRKCSYIILAISSRENTAEHSSTVSVARKWRWGEGKSTLETISCLLCQCPHLSLHRRNRQIAL